MQRGCAGKMSPSAHQTRNEHRKKNEKDVALRFVALKDTQRFGGSKQMEVGVNKQLLSVRRGQGKRKKKGTWGEVRVAWWKQIDKKKKNRCRGVPVTKGQ